MSAWCILQNSYFENVLVHNFRTAELQWLPGVIKELSVANSYKVQLDNDNIVWRYVDHILAWQADCVFPASNNDSDDVLPYPIATQTFTSDEVTLAYSTLVSKKLLTISKLRGESCGILNKKHKNLYITCL